MSSSVTTVSYGFNLTAVRGDYSDSAYPVFTSACGMTDALALAFAQSFLDLPWPTGTTPQAYVTKHETDEIQSEGNLTNHVFS